MEARGEKAGIRREVLEARDAIRPSERLRAEAEILSTLTELPEYVRSGTVLGYCSFGSEPETRSFLQATLDRGKRLILPRVDRTSQSLSLHEVRDLACDLVAGVWGIMEPDAMLPKVPVSELDFVLVPGVAFDHRGGRLGYGGGYYDRLLGGLTERPALVAAAFPVQVIGAVPVEDHDIRVDGLVVGGD